jgi:NAD(P)-dependent dehydrogenase (short-subunit alcohol dehydrogenase family)
VSLQGQTVVVIGGSSGMGLSTARGARAAGAEVILTARNAERLQRAADEVGARATAAFDASDLDALERFMAGLDAVDHVLVTAGRPYYAPLAEFDLDGARRSFDEHVWMPIRLAQLAAGKVRGSLLFVGGTGGRRLGVGLSAITAASAALPALIANLALEAAPLRVNLIAPGFVDTPLSAELLGDALDARRAQLASTVPIGRVVGPDDVASLALHLMANTALTGATYDVDGGQQLLPAGA